jgi:hypothetical protein
MACGQITRLMRSEHRAAIVALGLDPHRELVEAYEGTAEPKAWLIDGELAAIGGVAGPAISPIGILWLALAERAVRFPGAVVREATRQIGTVRDSWATHLVAAAHLLFVDPQGVAGATVQNQEKYSNSIPARAQRTVRSQTSTIISSPSNEAPKIIMRPRAVHYAHHYHHRHVRYAHYDWRERW